MFPIFGIYSAILKSLRVNKFYFDKITLRRIAIVGWKLNHESKVHKLMCNQEKNIIISNSQSGRNLHYVGENNVFYK